MSARFLIGTVLVSVLTSWYAWADAAKDSLEHDDEQRVTNTQEPTDAWSQPDLLLGNSDDMDTPDGVISKIKELIALQEFESAIELATTEVVQIEREAGRFDLALVQPLTLLGDSVLGMNDYVNALTFYDRAREINRQNLGLHELSQVTIVYKEAEAHLRQGNIYEANDRQEYAYSLFIRKYGFNSIDQLPGLFSLADWYTKTFNIYAARGLYENAIRLTRESLDESDPRLMRALKGLVRTYKLEKFRPSIIPQAARAITPRPYGSLNNVYHYKADVNNFAPGEQALIDIVNIESSRSESNSLDLAHAKLNLADWYMLFEKYERAYVIYQDIWQTFADNEMSTFIEDEMTFPKLLFKPLTSTELDKSDENEEDIVSARVEFKLTVTARGKTRNIEKISVDPEGTSVSDIKYGAKRSRYRPGFVDGAPVTVKDVAFVHKYQFVR